MKLNSRRLLLAGLVLAAAAASPATASATSSHGPSQEPSVDGLRILLTNDDSVQARSSLGTDGKGLYELRQALCAAGADVVVVGPWGQQSGSSVRVTTPGAPAPPLTVTPVTPPAPFDGDCGDAASGGPVYGVCQDTAPCTENSRSASPADAVLVALERFVPDNFWADGPDLVVSGTNFGQNVGDAVNHSGTVGAVVTARKLGAPAIAMSAELDFRCGPDPFACVPFDEAGDFAVDLVGKLRAERLLRPGLTLNVNIPVVRDDESPGQPVHAVVGTGTNLASAYDGTVTAEGGTYTVTVGEPLPETRRNADTTALDRNDIPITSLDGDWTATSHAHEIRAFIRHGL